MQIFFNGILLQASLILTLGAQNLFLMDVGIKKNNHFLAAAICALCDVLLIFFGIFSVSGFIATSPYFKVIIGMVGAVFLFSFSIMKFIEAFSRKPLAEVKERAMISRKQIILATLGFTLLNPHVYLETVFVIGGISTQFNTVGEKTFFGLGAGAFSVIWFYFLALFSSRFSKVLSNRRNMRIVSFITGILLGYLSLNLGMEAFEEFM